MEARTSVCGNRLGWTEVRGERLIKYSDSWFSAKAILVARSVIGGMEVKHCISDGEAILTDDK